SFTKDGDVSDSTYDNVASAFTGVGTSFEKVKDKFENVKDEITKEVADAKSDSLNWSESKNAFVAQHGLDNSSSKIHHLRMETFLLTQVML
uniref:hypothetical protein n=1 Tax=Bartonella sp. OC66QHHN TaxID=3243566 RepID=UPI0035D0F5FD